MNRSQQTGTPQAKRLMGELRARKASLAVQRMRQEYCLRHGIDPFDTVTFQAAKIAAGLPAFGGGIPPNILPSFKPEKRAAR